MVYALDILSISFYFRTGQEDKIKSAIEKGKVFPTAQKYGLNTLHYAAAYNNIEIVKALLDQGWDINQKTSPGYCNRTPLKVAKDSFQETENVITFLMSRGAIL